jgi:flagellar motor protein MotB
MAIVILMAIIIAFFSPVAEDLVVTSTQDEALVECTTTQSTKDEAKTISETVSENCELTTEETTKVIETTEPVVETTTEQNTVENDIDNSQQYQEDYLENQPNSYNDNINCTYDISEYELELVARTIYCEAGGCSEYCQWLVGSTILNLADVNGGIVAVTSNSNMFNVADYLYNSTPSDLSYSVARRVLSGDRDYNVMAFRASYYHSFGIPYTNVDNMYFSTY